MGKKGKVGALVFLLASATAGGGYYVFDTIQQKDQSLNRQQLEIDRLSTAYNEKVTELEEHIKQAGAEKKRLEDLSKLQTSRDTSLEVGYQRKIESLEQELRNTELKHKTELKDLEQSLQDHARQVTEHTEQIQILKNELARRQQIIDQTTRELQAQQAAIPAEIHQEKHALEHQIQVLEQTLQDREQQLNTLKQTIQEQNQRVATLSEKILDVGPELTHYEGKISQLTTQLQEQEQREKNVIAQKEAEILAYQEKQREFEQKIAELSAEQSHLNELFADQTRGSDAELVKELQGQLATVSQQFQEVQRAHDELTHTLAEKDTQIQTEQTAKVYLTRTITEKEHLISEKEARIQQLIGQVRENRVIIDGLETHIQEMKTLLEKIADNRTLEKNIGELTTLIQKNEADLNQTIQGQLMQQVQELTQELEKTRNSLSFQDQIAQLTAQLSDSELKKIELQTQIQEMKIKLGDLARERDQFAEQLTLMQEALQTQQQQSAQIEEKVQEQEQLTARLAELQEQLQDKEQELRAEKATIQDLTGQVAGLQEAEKQLQQQLTEKEQSLKELQHTLEQDKTALAQQIADFETKIAVYDQQQLALSQTHETQLADMQKTIGSLQTHVSLFQQQIDALRQEKDLVEKQNQALNTSMAQLQQTLSETQAKANEYQVRISWLGEDLKKRETEYLQLKETHDQALNNLKAEIENENLEKETIQKRLQEQLDRSNEEYQQRLEALTVKKEQEIQELKSLATNYQNLVQDLKKEIDEKTITIEQIQERLTVKIVDRILFPTGSAQVNSEGIQVLNTIGESLKKMLDGRQIRVEGHTDSRTIGPDLAQKYPTNWELSVARATNVVRYLAEKVKIPASKLYAVGYGSHRPVADNDTEEGRSLNRRIEIVLTPELEEQPLLP